MYQDNELDGILDTLTSWGSKIVSGVEKVSDTGFDIYAKIQAQKLEEDRRKIALEIQRQQEAERAKQLELMRRQAAQQAAQQAAEEAQRQRMLLQPIPAAQKLLPKNAGLIPLRNEGLDFNKFLPFAIPTIFLAVKLLGGRKR